MQISHLEKRHDRISFDCGVEPLNEYLRKFALQNQKKDYGRTYVASSDDGQIAGFYTLVFGSVTHSEGPTELSGGAAKYPIPIILLARLAVDLKYRGRGLGARLLADAMRRSEHASQIAGLKAFFVKAKDENAQSFYTRHGFQPTPLDPMLLYLKISDIRASLYDSD